MTVKDYTNQKINSWTFLEFVGIFNKATVWKCKCDCGTMSEKTASSARIYKQCKGCSSTTHGGTILSKESGYNSWEAIKQYCYNTNSKYYDTIGSIGIQVCDRWKDSFETFQSDMGTKPKNYVLRRINTTKDYTPDNCVWSSKRCSAGRSKKNATGYSGVYYESLTGQYRASIDINGETLNLGRFRYETHAALAYDKAIIDYNLPRDCLNFPNVVKSLTGE